jgi:hypothetical protein
MVIWKFFSFNGGGRPQEDVTYASQIASDIKESKTPGVIHTYSYEI